VPLDFSLAKEALEISSAPDVLLLPSDLAPFVKVIIISFYYRQHIYCNF
jgi:DNA polymerase alpha subunit B